MNERAHGIDMPQIGERMQKQRELLHLTQKELSEMVNCNTHYISDIECGRSLPSSSLLISLAGHLNISLDYLIYGTTHSDLCPASLMNLIEMCTADELSHVEYYLRTLLEIRRKDKPQTDP